MRGLYNLAFWKSRADSFQHKFFVTLWSFHRERRRNISSSAILFVSGELLRKAWPGGKYPYVPTVDDVIAIKQKFVASMGYLGLPYLLNVLCRCHGNIFFLEENAM